ncbi:MAG: acetyl-CoA acetyltransferase [Armatimonadetes bacterium]|nr:acetyl-CoA acetyltransferase [Armatimonadota bacterium]
MRKAAIVGMGYTVPQTITPQLSYREMIFEAAVKAYENSGIHPKDVQSFICVSEDFLEGVSIFDEYVPDQLGANLKSVHTISADGIFAIISGFLQILTGKFDIVLVEAHSKASNILNPNEVIAFAQDPVYNQPLRLNPHYIAGLEMNRFLYSSGNTREQCAKVVVKNKKNALKNPLSAYPAKIEIEDVLNSALLSDPLRKMDKSQHADAACVFILASEKIAKSITPNPIWIKGAGWCSDDPSLETRNWDEAVYAKLSARQAYKMAGIQNPKQINLAEIDDSYSYKELQHLESMGLCRKGESGLLLEEGYFEHDGSLPVNISGGNLGAGFLFEASGAFKIVELILQLSKEAGCRQVKNASLGLAQVWRGVPTATGAVIILERED